MQRIATYGSLKRGFYNHGRMGVQEYLGNMVVKGDMTLVYNAYPQLFLNEGGKQHEVEVFEVSEDTFNGLHQMEIGAGYKAEIVETPFGEATMWVYANKEDMSGEPIDAYSKTVLDE